MRNLKFMLDPKAFSVVNTDDVNLQKEVGEPPVIRDRVHYHITFVTEDN